MILKLKDIATVSLGVTFCSRIEASKDGGVRVIQMKDLGDDNFVHLNESIHIKHSKPKPNQLAKLGDIIFRSRGQTNAAALLNEDAKAQSWPLHYFVCDQILKRLFLSFCFGGSISRLHRLTSLQDQRAQRSKWSASRAWRTWRSICLHWNSKKMADFFSLSMGEQQLLEEIKNRKAIYTQGILMQMASESRPTASNKTPGFDAATSTQGQTYSRARNKFSFFS